MAVNGDTPDVDSGESIDDFMARRQREAAAFAAGASTAHQAYGYLSSFDQPLNLSQPSDLANFGASLLTQASSSTNPNNATFVSAGKNNSNDNFDLSKALHDAALQADTAVRTASNILTFGGADRLAAAGDALFQPGGLAGWGDRYKANLAQEQARNQYDSSYRQGAQALGFGVGTAAGLGIMGPMEGALAGAAALSGREAAGIVGAGGATGLGTQIASDLVSGRKSSPGDTAGAILGGMTGAVALPLGPARAAAVGGGVTSATQDLFNGRPVSFDHDGESALAGNLFGGLGGVFGRVWSTALTPRAKGVLGEALGNVRSTLNGQPRNLQPKMRNQPTRQSSQYWYPDGVSGTGDETIRFEDKFGTKAALSNGQKFAQQVLGSNFQLYHFLPADIGAALGLSAGLFANSMLNKKSKRQPKPQ